MIFRIISTKQQMISDNKAARDKFLCPWCPVEREPRLQRFEQRLQEDSADADSPTEKETEDNQTYYYNPRTRGPNLV